MTERLIRIRRSRWFIVPFAAGALSLLSALVLADSAAALPSNCSPSDTMVTCTFATQGSEGTFTVPGGVTGVHVVANGGAGVRSLGGAGGPGAQVGSDLSVTPGSVLFVEVGIGGGGAGSADAAGGGGESDVRTCSITDSSCHAVDGSTQDPRLVVAGGGGGAGGAGGGGSGGAGGVGTATCNPGLNGTAGASQGGIPPVTTPRDGLGGNGGGCTSGGTGGAAGTVGGGSAGGNGTASSGGNGGVIRGGGGGAGFFGGGGGGGGGCSGGPCNGGGGGGGSSFGPTGSVFTTATTGPSVAISYALSASALAAILVSDSAGKGPGKALAHKAAAIQAAVTAGQTATACADITDYLGLVNAQTGKKLSASDARTLTNDANNLAAALGC
jgi:hypothetical protein